MEDNRPEEAIGAPRHLWIWPTLLAAVVAVICTAVIVTAIVGQDAPHVNIPRLLDDVGITPKLNAQVPLDVTLNDESGRPVRLDELTRRRPIVLALVYYRCPMLCTLTMDGLVRSMSGLSLSAGDDFTVLTVSFDPREDPSLAAAAKRAALDRYGRPGAADGWRFLTGEENQVRRLADAVGFRYQFDPATGQYAHAAGLVVLTPDGVVSRCLYGIDYSPRDFRLAVVEASAGNVGSVTDRVLLLCYHYDPSTGKYGLTIVRVLQFGGTATVTCIGLAIGVALARERKLARRSRAESA
jgi:protein SCO1/2